MGYEDEGAGALRKNLLQRFDRGEIEVIGRLVHDDEMRLLEQPHSQHHLPELAGTQFVSGQHPLGRGVESRDDREHLPGLRRLHALQFFQNLSSVCRINLLGNIDEVVVKIGGRSEEHGEECGFPCSVASAECNAIGRADEYLGIMKHPRISHIDRASFDMGHVAPF